MIDDSFTWADTPFLSIDTETTGFSRNDRICEIAILVVRGEHVLETFHSLVNPGCYISEGATNVHGITNEQVESAPPFSAIKDKVLDLLCRDIPWVAHQLSFDARMLSYDIPREEWPVGVPTLCTLEYAKKFHGSLKLRTSHKLLDLAGHLHINYDPKDAHNAMDDAVILGKIVPAMMGERPIMQSYTRLSHDWLK
jgi:DNA polymerase III subunit epsilon